MRARERSRRSIKHGGRAAEACVTDERGRAGALFAACQDVGRGR